MGEDPRAPPLIGTGSVRTLCAEVNGDETKFDDESGLGGKSDGFKLPDCASGDAAVVIRVGCVRSRDFGMGTRGDGAGSSSLLESFELFSDRSSLFSPSLSVNGLSAESGPIPKDMELCLDLTAPGWPVRGLITSETIDFRRSGKAWMGLEPLEKDWRGDGRAKLDGVRGRDTGDWSRM